MFSIKGPLTIFPAVRALIYVLSWFLNDLDRILVLPGSQETTSKSWSFPLTFNTLPPSCLPPYQLRQNKYLFPRRGLLTASKLWESPSAHSCETRQYSPPHWGTVTFTPAQSVLCLHRSFFAGSVIRQGNDTIAMQSTAWQLDRLPRATSHILPQSISDKPAETGHQTRRSQLTVC